MKKTVSLLVEREDLDQLKWTKQAGGRNLTLLEKKKRREVRDL